MRQFARHLLSATIVLGLGAAAFGQPKPPEKELASAIRSLLLANLPEPLIKNEASWGRQADGVFVNKKRNHGVWRKLYVKAFQPGESLHVEIRNLTSPEANRHRFDMIVDLAVAIDFQQQVWEHGIRLWSGSTRARAKAKVALKCEVETRVDSSKGKLLDVVLRWRVLQAELTYRDLDVIHLAKFGGDFAEIVGKALHNCVREFRPDIEKDLLKKANAAIVLAGDNKEVRICLSKLLQLD